MTTTQAYNGDRIEGGTVVVPVLDVKCPFPLDPPESEEEFASRDGAAERDVVVPWRRCPSAFIKYCGLMESANGNLVVHVFRPGQYPEAVTTAAVWHDNYNGLNTCTVRVHYEGGYNDVNVTRESLKNIKMPGQPMWKIVDGRFIEYDGEKGLLYTGPNTPAAITVGQTKTPNKSPPDSGFASATSSDGQTNRRRQDGNPPPQMGTLHARFHSR